MKPRFHKLPQLSDSSFSIARTHHYHSWNDWHYHQELEVILIEEGEGTRFIGDRIDPIVPGELFLIGANLPHMFRYSEHLYESEQLYQNLHWKDGFIPKKKQMLTLHFDTEIFGERFLHLPENQSIVKLFMGALHGMQFHGKTKDHLSNLMNNLLIAPHDERMLILLQLLTTMAKADDRSEINSTNITHIYNNHDETHLTKIYLYTLNNFSKIIKLKNAAEIVYMDPNSFCRYFKSRTNKSYFTFLLEVRVNHACKMLAKNDFNMGIISFESGFRNISNFNRHFKQITGKTPLEYRKYFKP